MTPVGLTAAGGALVACTAAVGTAVGSADPGVVPGSAVAGTSVACAGVVGVELLGCGVAVADDPQANSRATNSNTIAFGRCRAINGLDDDFGKCLPPVLRIANIKMMLFGKTLSHSYP